MRVGADVAAVDRCARWRSDQEVAMQADAALAGATAVAGEPIAVHEVRGGGGLRLNVREWGSRDDPSLLFIHGWS